MEDREEELVKRHENFLNLLFHKANAQAIDGNKSMIGFPPRLSGEDSLFLVSGKAGSGMSTPMRFHRERPNDIQSPSGDGLVLRSWLPQYSTSRLVAP